ncbi:MAG TPA: BON domain-containing protein [Bryobacteraceae bacterium]|jgi:osmotically-inducible protein OsmY|nr:BON domain-containing protein [Bryobacteraceae bacterium]
MRYLWSALLVGLITFSSSCSNSDRKEADRKAAEAKAKAQQTARETGAELKRLGQEAKSDARRFGASAHRALQGGGATPTANSGSLKPKLGEAGEKARLAGDEAAAVLDRATLVARVKSKLAADAGLSTLSDVSVDTSGHVVTLKGTVNSEQQRRLAEEAAIQVNGVSKVVDDLTVRQ